MGKHIKPIPTEYNGVKYRSRLEARWAVFFDQLGVKNFYEYEGFQLPSGWYVPDFYLPDIRGGLWVEIKPKRRPTQEEGNKCQELSEMTGNDVLLYCWDIEYPKCLNNPSFLWSKDPRTEALTYPDPCYLFCRCHNCGSIGVEFNGEPDRICNHVLPEVFIKGNRTRYLTIIACHMKFRGDSPHLLAAYETAQKWSFY